MQEVHRMSVYTATRTVTKIEANPLIYGKKDECQRLRVAAYCRVSTDEEDQLNSLDTQIQYYTSKIAENPNCTLAGIYPDEGITGTRTDKRDQFLKLMRDCEKGKVDYIITKSTSRFARNTVDSLSWIRKLRSMGIGIYFEEQNLDSLKAENEMLIGFFSVMAQSESESISANVKWGIQKRMRAGTYSVRFNMLGYRKDHDGNPIIVPEEADLVRKIFHMFLDGASMAQLKKYLESHHIKTASGKDIWSMSVIRSMLTNEKYVGDVLYQKTFRTDCISKKTKVNRGEMTRYLISNNHSPIIDRETFNSVQAELSRRNNIRKKLDFSITEQGKYSSKYALSELLICGCCGGAYKRTSKVANGKTVYYWRCLGRMEHGKSFCKDSAGIEEKMLQDTICRCLSKMIENSQDVLELIKGNLFYAVSGDNSTFEMYAVEKQINQLKKEISTMTDLAAKTEGNIERYENELKKMFESLTVLRNRYDLAKIQAAQNKTVSTEVEKILTLLKNMDWGFTEYNDIIIRRLVKYIRIFGKEKLVVTLKGGYQAEEKIYLVKLREGVNYIV